MEQKEQSKVEYWRQIIVKAEASSLSINEWCRQNGIKSRKFYYWRKRLREIAQPSEGTLFLFCGHNRSCIKGLIYEGYGYAMITKRLSDGVYQWPRDTDEAKVLSQEAFRRLPVQKSA